jgi:hypothetical protein
LTLDWLEVVLTSSVVATVINVSVEDIRRRWSDKRDARYLAQRLAIILETFAIDCADVISGNELHRDNDGYAGDRRLKLPSLAEFPADADWKAINPLLAGRVAAFPNEIRLSEQKISFYWDVLREPDCTETETNQQAGKCGYRAWNLAVELRNRHGLPVCDLTELTWDFVAKLREQYEAAIKSRHDDAQRRAEHEAKRKAADAR